MTLLENFRRTRQELVRGIHACSWEPLLTYIISGGALGWKKRGELELPFEEAAFALEASTVTAPKYAEAKTSFGYHILMVDGRK